MKKDCHTDAKMSSGVLYDVIVVGAGIEGSATAYHLAKTNNNTLLLEQFNLPHTRGSSHGQSRGIRKAYNRTYYAQMMLEAFPLWEAFERETGTQLYKKTGALFIGPRNSNIVRETANSLKEIGATYDILDGHDLNQRFPMMRYPTDYSAVYDPDAGILLASKALQAFQNQFVKNGGKIQDDEKVTYITPGDIVTVTTTKGTYRARSIIITAGPWTNRLTKPLGLNLPLNTVATTVLYWKQKSPGQYSVSGGYANFVCEEGPKTDPLSVYSLVSDEYQDHVKILLHTGTPRDPENRDDYDITDDVKKVRGFIREHMPGVEEKPSIVEKCMYTLTPDEDLILDTHPHWKNIVIGAGFSGHGFKLSPVVGKILAALATGKTPDYSLEPFKIKRFNTKANL